MSEHTLMQILDMMILNQLWITGNSQASLLVVNSSYKAFYSKLSVWEKDFSFLILPLGGARVKGITLLQIRDAVMNLKRF